ncbi:MAG: aspartate ammonia-lyase [Clostridia bacterium]|nr:aspartate ammonia-lyase [Clostridia bacterium]
MKYRIEHDSIGSKEVPVDAYYGVQSLRGQENFQITSQFMRPEFIWSLAAIKKAAAIVNREVGILRFDIAGAIIKACDEILAGNLHREFIIDPIQGGAGTSANMNANEVIANRAIEILGGTKGDYSVVHPNDHVNNGQSTNDVIPTAGKITAILLFRRAIHELEELAEALHAKEVEFHDIIKMGRTQMQDAIPVRLGSEFGAFRRAVERDIRRFQLAIDELCVVNMGGTAIGTSLNAEPEYVNTIVPMLAQITGIPLRQAPDLIDGTQNLDTFVFASSMLKTCAVSLSKMSNDLRLMSSGPRCGFQEINLPAMQNGSSIMPGKVNPVIPEVMSQVAFHIIGNDTTITMAAEGGQLELNAFEPVLFYSLFNSLTSLVGGVRTFIDNCITGITANADRCTSLVDGSVGVITAICPNVGYQLAAKVAKEAIKTGKSVRELLRAEGIFTDEEIEKLLDPLTMV